MTSRLLRPLVLVVCATGVVGMIAGSASGNNGIALTFGLISAAAVVCLIVATAVGVGSARDGRAERQLRL